MKVTRKFTKAGQDVFGQFTWTQRTSRITNPDGSVVFEMKDVQVPEGWSQLATDIMVSKYFRKAGVPQVDEQGQPLKDSVDKPLTGPERSVKQVVHRLAGCWRHWGETHGYFDSAQDAQAFYDELAYMMLAQMAAPNSPQWFNTGLNWAYGISGPAQGHWVVDPESGEARLAADAYTHPQPHACFIQSIDDDLVNPGGIMDLWTREARLFKYGSGTGTNFSRLRGENEPLSGGGRSSGLMSFLKIGDRAAGAIKSGGTTRRAAKMVCLDLDHPDIENFVNWKVREEIKVAALVEGAKRLTEELKAQAQKLKLKLDYDFNGEAYATVSGQNSNNSVRIANGFFRVLDDDGEWELIRRTDGKVARKVKARDLWEEICFAAWRCADPGVQYDSTINQWHTCPVSGRINASNPCSEYMFLDNTACNLASLNLLKFYDPRNRHFDLEAFEHAVELWTVVLEISVLMAAFPSKEIARLSYEYRTLGLGYANLGAMLMQAGIAYDSEMGRAICGAISALMTGRAYATSAAMAAQLGPFAGFYRNRDAMLRVIRNHRRAAHGVPRVPSDAARQALGDYEGLDIRPVPIDGRLFSGESRDGCPAARGRLANAAELWAHAKEAWDEALEQGVQHGYRNAQTTVIAPTGTIGLLMDCDTTGVEPDFALVKLKKLAGGGSFKIANQSVRPALDALGYDESQVREILTYVMGTLNLEVPMPEAQDPRRDACATGGETFRGFLKAKGLTEAELDKLTDALAGAMELKSVFKAWTLGEEAMNRLGVAGKPDALKALGLNKRQIGRLNERICGTGTVEGAPHLKVEHLPVFDCANKCGKTGQRFISVEGHIRMMAAAQPFITGAISKTINLPHEATVDDIKASYRLSWELGLKANALYRDGCKLSQPLNSAADAEEEDEAGIEAGKAEVADQVADLASQIARAEISAPRNAAEMRQGPVEKIVEKIVYRPMRRRLADTRRSVTHKFNVAGHEGYITVGLYEDGSPGELFITMAKEGSTIGGLMDSLGTAISIALQYGVPLDSLVTKFTHQRFEPAGMTHNRDIPFAKSLVDYIFRWLGMEFIPGYRAANAPKRGNSAGHEDGPGHGSEVQDAGAKADGNGHGNGNGHGAGHGHGGNGHGLDNAGGGSGGGRPEVVTTAAARRLVIEPVVVTPEGEAVKPRAVEARGSALDNLMKDMQADAPACDVCGTITVRNGTCYKCLNCGNSMGCS